MRNKWITILCIIGILALSVVDVASLIPQVGNGFWNMGSQKTFHVALWLALACFTAIAIGNR